MSRKQVIAYYMHESELAKVKSVITGANETESFVMGTMDDSDMVRLQIEGLLIEEVPEAKTSRRRSRATASSNSAWTQRASIAPMASAKGLPADSQPHAYLVELKGPLLEEWRAALAATGVQLLEYVPHNTYLTQLTDAEANAVRNDFFFVHDVALDDGSESSTVLTLGTGSDAPGAPSQEIAQRDMLTFDILTREPSDLTTVVAWLTARHVDIAGSSGRKIRAFLLEDSPLVDEIASLLEVVLIEQYSPPRLFLDLANQLLGIAPPAGAGGVTRVISQRGKGEVLGIADTGLDDSHPDFAGRIAHVSNWGKRPKPDDPHGHGTHVAGIAVGDGSASCGALAGVAPEASVFFQSLLGPSGKLTGLPLNIGDLFEEAYKAGVRVHTNSWGSDGKSAYTVNAIEVDAFVADHRDMLIIVAAGNDGNAATAVNEAAGTVDWLSIASPATSKNALVVGASRSSRTSGGYSTMTYGTVWPSAFAANPMNSALVSGDPECLAGFSSRGPCDDHRIKPDVVAPGTDILSARSATAPLRTFWGAHTNPHYAYMGGTSMAAPLVAGCAVLVREYYVGTRDHRPSAALLKATLINGTRWLSGVDAIATHPQAPNYHQGFGAIHMPDTIPNSSNPTFSIAYRDDWQDATRQFIRTGQRMRFAFTAGPGLPLRLCLVWTDTAARSLQNNLDLLVEAPDGRKYTGNAGLFRSLRLTDLENNVETIRLATPIAGRYIVQIQASNLVHTGQDFALVAAGDVTSPLTDYFAS